MTSDGYHCGFDGVNAGRQFRVILVFFFTEFSLSGIFRYIKTIVRCLSTLSYEVKSQYFQVVTI